MVVCRLRKNREFHLNDNSIRNSPGKRDVPTVDDGTATLSGVDQFSMLEGVKTDGSCSKDCSSSHNSRSVEQVDTGSESDEKVANECSQRKEEDDCYADIMKDDIIKLDDSSLIENPRPLRVAVLKPKSEMKSKQSAEATVSVLPFQGTANRRLRLRGQRMESFLKEQFEIFKFETRNIPIEDAQDSQCEKKNEGLVANFPITQIFRVHFVLLFLVILILWILFLLMGNYMFGDGPKLGKSSGINGYG